ncbi:RecX family transcriptional regulator [Candidatus Microgenomates bacterium]|nr:RecX family transcriptional regulator [Candidatus Microgenomates bacterium]
MSKITSVESQKKNPRRFNIYLDGAFAFGADEDLVVEYRLVPGKLLEESDVEKLLFEAEVGKLMERMYRLWNIRPRSEKEVRNYLRSLSFKRKVKDKEEISEVVVELLIQKLRQKGMVDDEKFAKEWVRSKRISKYKGNRAITAELLQKGVDRNIIIEALKGDGNQTELAESALERKASKWKNLDSMEFRKKAYEFLMRRGFEYEVVKEVVENLNKKK